MSSTGGAKVEVERVYVINLRRTREVSRTKRSPYAIRLIRKFVARHMKVEPDKVKIGNDVNEYVWSRGIEKPPRRVEVRVIKYSDGTVEVKLNVPKEAEAKTEAKPS
ncbi:MAG: 50S ribosomal protein L31e [Vulcanisaeta sp.]|jgi:large subunit ribosomal protein L31e|nr:50S ribosomal protein L31e [Vulcanisaeta sp.]MCG2869260.1 50S ribosomal protein L31e [Vulcanisaeta sp.]MCG2880452.1 50S ribosomal protein L31e [Vulcanisaeta sp.]MCG2887475.1 50S ribosomal protein L31e [Vulcanisaeta sp.]MCG2891986.1 50S ribosomal protein L31e [Vulcanisaeta sp.]